jgi:hypothetical protein
MQEPSHANSSCDRADCASHYSFDWASFRTGNGRVWIGADSRVGMFVGLCSFQPARFCNLETLTRPNRNLTLGKLLSGSLRAAAAARIPAPADAVNPDDGLRDYAGRSMASLRGRMKEPFVGYLRLFRVPSQFDKAVFRPFASDL